MKKILSILVSLILSLTVLFSIGGFIKNLSVHLNQKKQLNDDAPTEQQIEKFKSQTENKCFYYYDRLSDDEKDAYITIYYRFFDFDESISLNINSDNLTDIFVAVLYDNPEIFWVDLGFEFTQYESYIDFHPQYRLNKDEVKNMQKELDEEINEIMGDVNSLNSDYEKELFIHDYIINVTEYDIETLDELGDSVYSSLVSGRSICEGYARTMQILLDKAGIYNYLVTGSCELDGKVEPHMWNVVNIDGENYHLDVTWNDLNEQNDIVHFYFNVTDEFISRDHIDIEPQNNNCISTSANYFVVEEAFIESFNGYSNHVERTVKKLSNGDNTVEFYFNNKNDYNKAVKYLNDNNGFFNYISAAVNKSGRNLKIDSVDYYIVEDYNYLCIVFKEG